MSANDQTVRRIDGHFLSAPAARALIDKTTTPIVFTNMITDWPAAKWSLQEFTKLFGHLVTTFKVHHRMEIAPKKKQKRDGSVVPVMETECSFVDATFDEFHQWLNSSAHSKSAEAKTSLPESNTGEASISNGKSLSTIDSLHSCPHDEYWAYADYKYMAEMFAESPGVLDAVDWSVFGFPNRNGFESTLWVSSEGAYTPCHQDTYGSNLIAQLHGTKRWILFSPDQTAHMKGTRVPYEESSVFSLADPKANSAVKYIVDLNEGDVLFLPKHWWHYVESLSPSISVNTWLEHETDSTDRLKESLVNMLVYSVKSTENEPTEKWLNPTQVLPESFTSCVELVKRAVNERRGCGRDAEERHVESDSKFDKEVDSNFLINCFTHPDVLDKVVEVISDKIK